MTPFGKWLADIGLAGYDVVFAANKIDFDVIHQMTDADLRELAANSRQRRVMGRVVSLVPRDEFLSHACERAAAAGIEGVWSGIDLAYHA